MTSKTGFLFGMESRAQHRGGRGFPVVDLAVFCVCLYEGMISLCSEEKVLWIVKDGAFILIFGAGLFLL